MITEPNFSISVTRLSGHNNASTTDVPIKVHSQISLQAPTYLSSQGTGPVEE